MTIADLTKYCEDNQDVIFVRAPKNGKWDSYSLSELDPHEVRLRILNWHLDGIIPIRMLES